MDRVSQLLAEGVPDSVPRTYRSLAGHGCIPRSTLHHRAHGRRSIEEKAQSQQYLTPSEDKAVVDFLLQMAHLGQPLRMKHIPAIAFSAVRQRPASKRPPKPPGRNWAKAFESRHPELKARRVRALDWNRHDKNIYEKITQWFEVIGTVLQNPAIVAENVYNMDETGVMLSVLGSVKVLTDANDTRDYRGARVKRTTVTAIECISGDGRYLKPMIIWPASTHRSNWTTFSTPGWHYACSDSGYTDSKISLEWLQRVFDPQTKDRAEQKPRVLICDGFGTHETLEVLEYCFANDITLCRLPSHTSHKLQPCDIAVFAPLKAAYRENVERMERGGVNTIGKEHFTSLYCPARERAFTKRNILAGWSKAGLFPFDPDRVLKDISNPLVGLIKAYEMEASPVALEAALQSPVTPMSAEGFMSLQNLIVERDAHTLDATNQRNLRRHLQKLAKAAQILFTKGTLQQDQIRFLLKINDEAKTRRSVRSLVLGKAKIMSYEDLEEARGRRREKEIEKAAKLGRRSRNVHVPVQEANASVPPTSEALERVPVEQMSEMQGVEAGLAPTPRRAPVARMW